MLLVLVTYQDMLFNLVPERQIPADKSHCQSSLSSCALILQGLGSLHWLPLNLGSAMGKNYNRGTAAEIVQSLQTSRRALPRVCQMKI